MVVWSPPDKGDLGDWVDFLNVPIGGKNPHYEIVEFKKDQKVRKGFRYYYEDGELINALPEKT